MHVDVTVADAGLDGGHRRVAYHGVDQPRSPARDHDVDEAAGLDQMGDAGAVVAGQQLHGVGGQALAEQRGTQRTHQCLVRMRRRRTAAQQHGVAGLQRQPERVDGDVGPALVDHADHAERNPLLAHLQAVGQRAAAQHLTDGIGQARDLPQSGGDAVDALRVQGEPVQHRLGSARPAGGVEVFGVGRQDFVSAGARASAAACSAVFFVAVFKVASSRAATRARRAASWTCWRKSRAAGACTLIDPAYRTCLGARQLSGRGLSPIAHLGRRLV